jgi:hypothetical protein
MRSAKRSQSDSSVTLIFTASGSKITCKFISILTPQAITYPVTPNQLKAKFKKQKGIRDIKIEDKELSAMSDKISSYTYCSCICETLTLFPRHVSTGYFMIKLYP